MSFKIVSGRSLPFLSKKIALACHAFYEKACVSVFQDKELYVQCHDIDPGDTVWIVQSMAPSPHTYWQEFLFIVDAVRRAKASFIGALIPYFSYARQDNLLKGAACPLHVMSACLESIGVDALFVVTPHNQNFQKFFSIPVYERDGLQAFDRPFQEPFVIVSPDQGGIPRAQHLAQCWHVPFFHCRKTRSALGHCTVHELHGFVKGRPVLLVDDCINTGDTICQAAQLLHKAGASKIQVYAVHGLLSGNAVSRLLQAPIEKIMLTNTIQHCALPNQIHTLCLAPFIAENLNRLHSPFLGM